MSSQKRHRVRKPTAESILTSKARKIVCSSFSPPSPSSLNNVNLQKKTLPSFLNSFMQGLVKANEKQCQNELVKIAKN